MNLCIDLQNVISSLLVRVCVLENETMDGPNPSQFIRIKPKMEERRWPWAYIVDTSLCIPHNLSPPFSNDDIIIRV